MKKMISATVALAGLLGAVGASADASESGPADANCRQETKRVAVWPRGAPKAPTMARFEDRQVTVCDSKAVSSRSSDGKLQAKDTGN